MKTQLALASLLFASLVLQLRAAPAEPTAPAAPTRELVIVVVDSIQQRPGAITDFDRIDMAFQYVAKQRKWPIKLKAERFADNSEPHAIELKINNQRPREETQGDLTYRGWMTLTVDGTKHDFGIIKYQHYRRAGENMDDELEKVFRGAANVAAGKIEPILFPELAATKR